MTVGLRLLTDSDKIGRIDSDNGSELSDNGIGMEQANELSSMRVMYIDNW